MSKGLALFLVVTIGLTACGGAVEPEPVVTPEQALRPATVNDIPPSGDPAPVDTRPRWEGFAATNDDPGTLAARLNGPLDVFATPGGTDAIMKIEPTTILGTTSVLGVIGQPQGDWVEVMLPVRPNGTTGWVRVEDVSLYVADSRIVVDLTDRELSYLVDGIEVLHTNVGIGSAYNQTPPGEYFVTDVVTLTNPNSVWGPHALGLSARSDSITEFNGGDGIIGIHGTNNPSSIGADISLGCIRLPNDMITALHSMVDIGTRVEINA